MELDVWRSADSRYRLTEFSAAIAMTTLVKSSLASEALKAALLRFIRIRLADESRAGRIGLVGLVHAVGDLRIAKAGLLLWKRCSILGCCKMILLS